MALQAEYADGIVLGIAAFIQLYENREPPPIRSVFFNLWVHLNCSIELNWIGIGVENGDVAEGGGESDLKSSDKLVFGI